VILSQEHKKKHYFFLSKRIVVCFLISITLTNAYAQTQRGRKDDAKAEEISFKDRWGIKTNAVDWLLTIPNIGVEFDLGNYWGVYVNASSYNLKIGKEGKQGNAYGAGISVGYTAPLYGYRNNYIDLELGGSAGLLYTSYDVYTHDAESNCYPRIADKCKGGHIVPFPLITDLRVAFVYRFMSVGSKYKASVYRRVQIRSEKRNAINAKINAMRLRIDSIAGAVQKQGFSRPDSLLTKEELKQWRLMQQERKEQALKEAADKLRKHVADSLGIQLSDTLTSEQEKTIDKALKEYEKQLKRKAEAQDSTKLGKRAAKDAKQAAKEKKGKKKKKESGKNKKKDGQQELKATKEDTEAKQEEAEAPDKEKKEDKA